MVMIVLLKVAWMWAIPSMTARFDFFRAFAAGASAISSFLLLARS
jgi:hypothetical protein